MLVWRHGLGRLLPQVVRDDHTGDGAVGPRDAQRAVEEVAHLGGLGRHVHVRAGNVLEQRQQVDLLLVLAEVIIAAISSWRVWTSSGRPSPRAKAAMTPLIPSPGQP